MKVTIIAVGKARGALGAAISDYEQRASRYWKLEVIEVEAGSGRGAATDAEVRTAEASRILPRIPDGADVMALTRGGKSMSSRGLARHLASLALASSAGIAFVLGGAFGLDDAVLARSKRKLSLSTFTLPHELARLVLAEQLYRAGTIHRNEPYHKEGS